MEFQKTHSIDIAIQYWLMISGSIFEPEIGTDQEGLGVSNGLERELTKSLIYNW